MTVQFMQTAHGIKVTGPAKVSGWHLSEAPNEPSTDDKQGLQVITESEVEWARNLLGVREDGDA